MSTIDESNHADRARPTGVDAAAVFWLQQSHQRLRQAILKAFREQQIDLSAAQWDVLSVLWQRDGLSQTDLAERSGRDKAGITRLVDGLVARELVERRRPPGNRRRYAIHLTAPGRRLHEQLVPIAVQVSERALANFGEEAKKTLVSGLKRVHGNLKNQDKSI